jgi:tetratricopeptide (TPR) repeat protein
VRFPLAGLVLAAALVGGAILAANAGRVADEFRGGEVANDPARLGSLSSNNRLAWWREARSIFEAQPVTGAGANTFEVARKRYRENASAVSQPHSVPLQFLAGTGLVGLALFLALVAAAGAAAVGALRRLDGHERDAGAALAVALALWLVHALVDYDWDFVAVTGPALFAAGVLAAAGRPSRRAPGLFAAAGAAALALAAVVSIATPWLAERELRKVNIALDRGQLEAAGDAVTRARSLDPLSLQPVFAEARVDEQRRREVAAHEVYLRATRLQPKNPESWLQLGLYEFDIGDRCGAYRHLNEAYTLDPAGKQWTPGGPLVVSLAWVNAGKCS